MTTVPEIDEKLCVSQFPASMIYHKFSIQRHGAELMHSKGLLF